MKKLMLLSACLLAVPALHAEQMQFVTTLSAPVGNFAQLDAADPTHVTSAPLLNFCNTRSGVGKIIIKGANAYLAQANILNGATLGSTNTPEYRLSDKLTVENGGTVTAGRVMASNVTFKDTNFHKSNVTGTLYGSDIAAMGGKADNMEIASTAKITKGAQAAANLGQTMEWSNQYSNDYDSSGNAKLSGKIYTSFLLKSKGADSCTPTKNGQESYSVKCPGKDNIYAEYRWNYTSCRYVQFSKCPDSSDEGKYTCFTSSTWKTKNLDLPAYVDTTGYRWRFIQYWADMVCGDETAHHSGYVTPKKGQEFDCIPGQYYLYNETYGCGEGIAGSSYSKLGWSCLKCAKTNDLSKCIVPNSFNGQNCSSGSSSGPLDFKENTDLDVSAKP
ncbi:hypothetical protein [Candidatus Avelusimicrobium sp.]|uniref:hypothetical protein n=1 Tax=Candidatus Avelusimicrobium sp. TaxID=3048833 RepID=UPI003D7C603F